MSSRQAELDLSSLRSFSPEWSQSLRLAVCIAVSYAGQRLCSRAQALSNPANTSLDIASHAQEPVGIDIGEEGKPLQRSGSLSPPVNAETEQRQRKDLVQAWEDFVQKFLAATCQHLGIDEDTLPPGPLLLRDILIAGQGEVEATCDHSEGEETSTRTSQALLAKEEGEGSETGSIFWRQHHQRVIRSDAVSDLSDYSKRDAETKQLDDETKAKVKDGLRQRQESKGSEADDDLDKKSMESDAGVLDDDLAHALQHMTSPSAHVGGSHGGTEKSPQRVGGALQVDGGKGREVEVFNDLLLVALGLGQYRSQDGATTLFEQEAIFDDVPQKRQSLSQDRQPPPISEPRLHKPAREEPEADSVQGLDKTWDSIRSGATSGWKWTSQASKKGVAQLNSSLGIAPKISSNTHDFQRDQEAVHKKALQAVKPNEVCHYDARARALILVAGAALGVQSRVAYDSEKVLAQTIQFIMNEARSAAKSQGKGDPLDSLPRGAAVNFQDGTVVSKAEDAEDAPQEQTQRTGWMNRAGTDAVKQQKKLGWKKWAVAGGGFALGGVILGVTGGLAAPLVVPALAGLTGITFLATSGGIIMLGTLFGLTGGGLAGYRVHRRLRGLDSFQFEEVDTQAKLAGVSIPSLHATICISGLILKESDQIDIWQDFWRTSPDSRDVYVVKSEAQLFAEAGQSLRSYVLNSLTKQLGTRAAQEVIKRTAFAALTAITLPMTVAGALGTGLDSLFVRAKAKAVKQGLVLAETLKAEVQGHRPVVLIGASVGAITVLTCLCELAKDPAANAHLVDSAYLICAPSTAGTDTLRRARSIVSRRMVNAFSRKDMVCGLAAWLGLELSVEDVKAGKVPRVVGSTPVIGIPGLENVDVSEVITSHFDLSDGEKVSKVCHSIGSMNF